MSSLTLTLGLDRGVAGKFQWPEVKLWAQTAVRYRLVEELQFEEVVRRHQDFVFRMLMRLTGSREQVEDLAQEVFLRLYRGLEDFRGEAKLTTYLYRITLNVAQDEWKRRRKEQGNTSLSDEDAGWENRLAHGDANAEQRLQKSEMLQQVNEALGELSAAEREVLVLFHQEECTYEQIAQVMQMPVNTVRTHLHRGRRRLKAILQKRSQVCGAVE